MTHLPPSAYLLDHRSFGKIYSERTQHRVRELTRPLPLQLTAGTWREHAAELSCVQYILSGWGMPVMDEGFLKATPQLKHVFYGAGSIRQFYTPEARLRGIGVSSAWRANAIPTAEFAHAIIILSLKKFWRTQQRTKLNHKWLKPPEAAGIFRSTVGIVSLGTIGRRVAHALTEGHTLNVLAYDPYATPADALSLGVRLVSLEELFEKSDVVSLHAPSLPETKAMISHELLNSMKPHATLVNTARGSLIDEPALVETLSHRTDLDAVLDVTYPEPCHEDHPLWKLPNVFITPHIAGSINGECYRMGEYMADELERYLAGLPLEHEVTEQIYSIMA